MLTHLAVVTCGWLIARFAYGVDMAAVAEGLGAAAAGHRLPILAAGFFFAVGLPVISLSLRGLGFFSLMYSLAKVCFKLSQFFVVLVALVAMFNAVDSGIDTWSAAAPLSLLPFFCLAGSSVGLYLFDFNYPLKEELANISGLALLSYLLVRLAPALGF